MSAKMVNKREINTYLKMVTNKFKKEGFKIKNLKINNYKFLIATKEQYSWKSQKNKLNVFAIVGASDNITKEIIEETFKGWEKEKGGNHLSIM